MASNQERVIMVRLLTDIFLKFIYSQKATKIWKKLPILFDITQSVQKKLEDFFQFFVAFSENVKFKVHSFCKQFCTRIMFLAILERFGEEDLLHDADTVYKVNGL
jgi:hypothetical protein